MFSLHLWVSFSALQFLQTYLGLFISICHFSYFIGKTIRVYSLPYCRKYKFILTTFPIYKVFSLFILFSLPRDWWIQETMSLIHHYISAPSKGPSLGQLLGNCLQNRATWVEEDFFLSPKSLVPKDFCSFCPAQVPIPVSLVFPVVLLWNLTNRCSLLNYERDTMCAANSTVHGTQLKFNTYSHNLHYPKPCPTMSQFCFTIWDTHWSFLWLII